MPGFLMVLQVYLCCLDDNILMSEAVCWLFIISWYHLQGDNIIIPPHTSSLALPGAGQESQIETWGSEADGGRGKVLQGQA